MKPITLIMSDITFRELGVFKWDGSTLTVTGDPAEAFVSQYRKKGMPDEEFVKKFTNWTNGMIYIEPEEPDSTE